MNEQGSKVDADTVIYRLEDAGKTLLSLSRTDYAPRLRASSLDVVRTALESYAWTESPISLPEPSVHQILKMEQAMAWLSLIPADRYVLRRVVGARSLVNPITDRHLFPWRRLGSQLGAEDKAIRRWHAAGISIIVNNLVDAGQSFFD